MAAWLTEQDRQNYGDELLDVSQRAALHAVVPHLQQLEQSNAELRQRLAIEARRNLDQRVAEAVPDFREIDADPRWHQWLRQSDQLSGVQRQQLLNDAISSGSVARVRAFFDGFRQEAGGTQQAPAAGSSSRPRSSGGKPIYTRDQVKELYRAHQQGAYVGREAEWARTENSIIEAGRENRILGGVDVFGK